MNSLTRAALAPGVSVSGMINSVMVVTRSFCPPIIVSGTKGSVAGPGRQPPITPAMVEADSAPPINIPTRLSASRLSISSAVFSCALSHRNKLQAAWFLLRTSYCVLRIKRHPYEVRNSKYEVP